LGTRARCLGGGRGLGEGFEWVWGGSWRGFGWVRMAWNRVAGRGMDLWKRAGKKSYSVARQFPDTPYSRYFGNATVRQIILRKNITN
jgi:hypothetical protein